MTKLFCSVCVCLNVAQLSFVCLYREFSLFLCQFFHLIKTPPLPLFRCYLAMGSLSLDFLSDFSYICCPFICNIPWWKAYILQYIFDDGVLEIITVSLHEQHFGDNIRTGCWGKYGSFVRGHSRLDREQRAVLFESPSCSRDIHSAHLSILPPMQPSFWLASAFLCQDVHDPSCDHNTYISERPTSASCDCVCFSQGCDIV